eukprot:jgi/Bigna1/82149/fgenesh1_pg.88_\
MEEFSAYTFPGMSASARHAGMDDPTQILPLGMVAPGKSVSFILLAPARLAPIRSPRPWLSCCLAAANVELAQAVTEPASKISGCARIWLDAEVAFGCFLDDVPARYTYERVCALCGTSTPFTGVISGDEKRFQGGRMKALSPPPPQQGSERRLSQLLTTELVESIIERVPPSSSRQSPPPSPSAIVFVIDQNLPPSTLRCIRMAVGSVLSAVPTGTKLGLLTFSAHVALYDLKALSRAEANLLPGTRAPTRSEGLKGGVCTCSFIPVASRRGKKARDGVVDMFPTVGDAQDSLLDVLEIMENSTRRADPAWKPPPARAPSSPAPTTKKGKEKKRDNDDLENTGLTSSDEDGNDDDDRKSRGRRRGGGRTRTRRARGGKGGGGVERRKYQRALGPAIEAAILLADILVDSETNTRLRKPPGHEQKKHHHRPPRHVVVLSAGFINVGPGCSYARTHHPASSSSSSSAAGASSFSSIFRSFIGGGGGGGKTASTPNRLHIDQKYLTHVGQRAAEQGVILHGCLGGEASGAGAHYMAKMCCPTGGIVDGNPTGHNFEGVWRADMRPKLDAHEADDWLQRHRVHSNHGRRTRVASDRPCRQELGIPV